MTKTSLSDQECPLSFHQWHAEQMKVQPLGQTIVKLPATISLLYLLVHQDANSHISACFMLLLCNGTGVLGPLPRIHHLVLNHNLHLHHQLSLSADLSQLENTQYIPS